MSRHEDQMMLRRLPPVDQTPAPAAAPVRGTENETTLRRLPSPHAPVPGSAGVERPPQTPPETYCSEFGKTVGPLAAKTSALLAVVNPKALAADAETLRAALKTNNEAVVAAIAGKYTPITHELWRLSGTAPQHVTANALPPAVAESPFVGFALAAESYHRAYVNDATQGKTAAATMTAAARFLVAYQDLKQAMAPAGSRTTLGESLIKALYRMPSLDSLKDEAS